MKKTTFAAFLGSIIIVLAPISANARNPPKPHHACPKGEHWVLQPKFLDRAPFWSCVPNHQPPPK
jgi:hypothetical protein